MEQITQSQPALRLLLVTLSRRAMAAVGRRQLCCGTATAAARRRNLPRYRFELENRLLFGSVVRKSGGASPPADTAPEPDPPARMTVVSESGFLEGRVGRPVRSRSTSAASAPASAVLAPADAAAAAAAASSSSSASADSDPAATATATASPSATASASASVSTTNARNAPIRARPPVVPAPISYLYPADEDGAGSGEPASRLPSVSRVLQATMSEESRAALQRWEQMMIARHGPDGFAQLKEAMFSAGRELHEAIHGHLVGRAPRQPLSSAAAGFWRSVRPVLQHVNATEMTAAELPLRHHQLGYQGIVDCVAPFRSCPMVIEWKTARRPKNSVRELYDNPVQAAAYLGAYNYMHRKAQVDRAAVVVAYESGRPATVHVLSPAACRHYWSVWLRRLLCYRHEADVM